MRKKWLEILEKLTDEDLISWQLKPIDIKVAGLNKDVWLEEVLIVRKKKRS